MLKLFLKPPGFSGENHLLVWFDFSIDGGDRGHTHIHTSIKCHPGRGGYHLHDGKYSWLKAGRFGPWFRLGLKPEG